MRTGNHRIYQIRKNISARPAFQGNVIGITKNVFPDTFISNCRPVSNSNDIRVKVLYEGKSDTIPDDVIDEVLTIATNVDTSKQPFRWYQFTSEAAAISDLKGTQASRRVATKTLLERIGTPEFVWIFEVLPFEEKKD